MKIRNLKNESIIDDLFSFQAQGNNHIVLPFSLFTVVQLRCLNGCKKKKHAEVEEDIENPCLKSSGNLLKNRALESANPEPMNY